MPGKQVNGDIKRDVAVPASLAATVFPLENLAWTWTKNAIAVSQYLSTHDLPQPSHKSDGPSRTLPKDAPPNVQCARQSLMDAALQLFQLAAGPSEFIPNLAPGLQYVSCLAWLVRFDIFHLIPASGTISYTDLAAAASLRAGSAVAIPETRLKSIVRMAMTSAIFCEAQPNRVGHSATSALLARDPNLHLWASYLSTRSGPTALSMTTAHDSFTPASVAKNETAYNVAFGTDLPFFDHLALEPASTAEFAGYMRNVTTSTGVDIKHLVNGYPWAEIGAGLVVDVGGSTGNAAIALAQSFPDLKFIVQDLPDNANAGRIATAASFPDHILSRITFQGHDFMEPQPVGSGDVYLLRMILHDWPDHEAAAILKNMVPVLERGTAKLLIMDTVLPASGQVPASVERILRVRDLTMMQVFNSHERDLDQWKALLAAADERLQLRRVMEPFGSTMSLLEVGLDRDVERKREDEEEDWDISG